MLNQVGLIDNIHTMEKRKVLSPAAREYFRQQGSVGGKARAANLPPEERRRIASLAAKAREAKRRDALLATTPVEPKPAKVPAKKKKPPG